MTAPTTFTTVSVAETIRLGEALGRVLAVGDIVALTGDLGAGKTHFTKGVALGLGVEDEITSPTFNILLVYEGRELPLYHFDLYRLDDASQLDDIDYFGLLEADGVSVVEWGDRFEEALTGDVLLVELNRIDDTARSIVAAPTGPRSLELAAAWQTGQGEAL